MRNARRKMRDGGVLPFHLTPNAFHLTSTILPPFPQSSALSPASFPQYSLSVMMSKRLKDMYLAENAKHAEEKQNNKISWRSWRLSESKRLKDMYLAENAKHAEEK